MATPPLIDQIFSSAAISENSGIMARERQKSLMLRAWIASGLFFMALPGTLLGFSNLMAISAHHGLGTLPAAWMEGHGHAQVFGWIGSFILGIGFYSQPSHGRSVIRLPLSCYVLWTSGVALRWFANIYGWHWRALLPVSAGFELIAVFLFLSAASHHKLPTPVGVSGQRRVWNSGWIPSWSGLPGSLLPLFLTLSSAFGWACKATLALFPTRWIRNILYCLAGDLSFQWSGDFPRDGCRSFLQSRGLGFVGFRQLYAWI